MIKRISDSGISVAETEAIVERALAAEAAETAAADGDERRRRTVSKRPPELLPLPGGGSANEAGQVPATDPRPLPAKSRRDPASNADPFVAASDQALYISSGKGRVLSTLAPVQNTMERAVRILRLAGVEATVRRVDGIGETTFSITVPTSVKGSA